ncbi:Shedu immune nuclease family protein [Pseudomonas nitroreducens]|uniref:DUF4263 domain-containing protein n=1 Tax=Pseudomonas nitroreducens TaxID=46680 RepID=A0A6G6J9N7_PSENT|nr:Shedu immune nuclease family protein [Pseudomonas nitroreducens]QIE91191.1 DUF4263 domain-containing protein [Pseudomonas nitroreducens]
MSEISDTQNDGESDFDGWDDEHEDLIGALGQEGHAESAEEDGYQSPDDIRVALETSTFNGEACAEIYAYDEQSGTVDSERKILLARINDSELTMYPLDVDRLRRCIRGPKYDELTTITVVPDTYMGWELPRSVQEFDEILTVLPIGFSRYARYGLGFKWEYRLIPEAILEEVGVTELRIEPGDIAKIELPVFRLGMDRFTAIRKSIDSIAARSRVRSLKDRRLAAYNETLHAARPNEYERRFPEVKANEIYELVKLGGKTGRSSNRSVRDGLAAAQVVREDAQKLAKQDPSKLFELKAVIEQVTLAQLIGEFESMLQKKLPEQKWQDFFKANPFVLGLAFPYPVILLKDQAHVGGTTISGKDESIVDFLIAQRFTGNLAIVEIKRPDTPLLYTDPYRGDLYSPHRELTGSMAQALDQRAQLLHHFAAKKSLDPALSGSHVSSVNCIVIVGTLPEGIAQVRSLDIFRHSSKDVSVVTFQELLEKLKELYRLMSAGEQNPVQSELLPSLGEPVL